MQKLVKPSVDHVCRLKFPSGNYPPCIGDDRDLLVHWCHGSPGVIYMLLQAHRVRMGYSFTESQCHLVVNNSHFLSWSHPRSFLSVSNIVFEFISQSFFSPHLFYFFAPDLRGASVPGQCPAVRRGGVAFWLAEEGLWSVSRCGRQRLCIPGPIPAYTGPQAPV